MSAIDTFIETVAAAAPTGPAFTPDAEVDATVPQWRLHRRGREAVEGEFARWYAHPGTFEDLIRTPIPGGEVVEWVLCWEEDGVPFACHQVHILQLGQDGLIHTDRVWCGGRWPAALLAEMAEAE